MRQTISFVTLGVSDLARSRAFYAALGWRESSASQPGIAFFKAGSIVLETDRTLDEVEQRHVAQHDAAQHVFAAIPLDWRRGEVERDDLSRFVFGESSGTSAASASKRT